MPTRKRSHIRRARASSRARTQKRRVQTGAGIWNRIRTLPGIRYITKKKLEKTASTECNIQDMAVISKFAKQKHSEIAPLSQTEANCLINKHRAANTHIFAYYVFNESTINNPCPSYEIKYMTKSSEDTIKDITESVLSGWHDQVSSQAPHVKYIIGKKISERVHESQLVEFGVTTGRPRIDAVIKALQFIFSNIGVSNLDVFEIYSVDGLNTKTTVENYIQSSNVTEGIIDRLNGYIDSINKIQGPSCATLNTDKLFKAYRILSNALDKSPSDSHTIPIYFYTYDNPSDYVFNNEKYNKTQFIKLSGSPEGIKHPNRLINLQAEPTVIYNEFIKNKPIGQFILILKQQ